MIKKAELLNATSAADEKIYAEQEKRIDAHLEDKFETTAFFDMGGVPTRVIYRLKADYEKAGWTIKFEPANQRDNASLTFT